MRYESLKGVLTHVHAYDDELLLYITYFTCLSNFTFFSLIQKRFIIDCYTIKIKIHFESTHYAKRLLSIVGIFFIVGSNSLVLFVDH